MPADAAAVDGLELDGAVALRVVACGGGAHECATESNQGPVNRMHGFVNEFVCG